MTKSEVQALDLRDYKGVAKEFANGKWWKEYGSRMTFNKKSVVFDNNCVFTLKPFNDDGNYSLWLEYNDEPIDDYVDEGVADDVFWVSELVKSICQYIEDRI